MTSANSSFIPASVGTSIDIGIHGMTCASCVGRVEKALKGVPGVLEATVNLATERARVRHLAGAVSIADLEAAVGQAGYKSRRLSAATATADEQDAERRESELREGLAKAGVDTLELATDDDLVDSIMRFADLKKQRSRLANWSGPRPGAMRHIRPAAA